MGVLSDCCFCCCFTIQRNNVQQYLAEHQVCLMPNIKKNSKRIGLTCFRDVANIVEMNMNPCR